MGLFLSEKVKNILACSNCGGRLIMSDLGAECLQCAQKYSYAETGAIDMRLKKPRTYTLDFILGSSPDLGHEPPAAPLRRKDHPEVDFSAKGIPRHLSSDILSYFPSAKSKDSLMLDLGCGNAIHREVCEQAGFEWVGLDYLSPKAPILGDAHALPFQNETFEFILSIAVMEHIRFPFVMMREAYRVMKPQGVLIGTVAFLEPFHDNSYYHHSYLGALNSLQYGGFNVDVLAPSEEWSVLMAQASMALFPRMPRRLAQCMILPVQTIHKLWWRMGSRFSKNLSESVRVPKTTGMFTFIATKPAN